MILLAVLVVPALGALLAVLLPGRSAQLAGCVAAGLTLVAAGFLYAKAPGSGAAIRPWRELDVPWVPGLHLRFHLGVDGISWPLILLTALLTLLCCLYTLFKGGDARLISLLLALEVGVLGVFLSLDLVLFFVFFEITLLPMYAIIAGWGGAERRAAARKFVLYTLLGSVLLLVGIYLVIAKQGTSDLVALSGLRGAPFAAFVFMALGFAVKSPLWPLHSWLPDAHSEAPTVGSVMLAGVMLKLGTYGLLRIALPLVPDAAHRAAPVLGGLAVAAILIGGLICLAQTELKRLIAYSSVGHMGFVLLGIATGTEAGFQAALIGNIAHGLITGLLFFLVGAIKDRTHTGELADLGGLRETAPGLAALLGFAAIASLGLPGLAGFWGEAFAVVAAVHRGWLLGAVLAALGGALAAAYLLRLLRRVTHGPAAPAVVGIAPVARYELASWLPLVALTVALGVAPFLLTAVTQSAVAALVEAINR